MRPQVDRLFFALRPERERAHAIVAWSEQALGTGWELQSAERLHVTLAITDDVGHDASPELITSMAAIGERVAAEPFTLCLDKLVLTGRSAALRPSRGNAGLRALNRSIRAAMENMRVSLRDKWAFSPHMTLGYRKGPPMEQPAPRQEWLVEDFVLIRSLVGRTRHVAHGRWPLRPIQYTLF